MCTPICHTLSYTFPSPLSPKGMGQATAENILHQAIIASRVLCRAVWPGPSPCALRRPRWKRWRGAFIGPQPSLLLGWHHWAWAAGLQTPEKDALLCLRLLAIPTRPNGGMTGEATASVKEDGMGGGGGCIGMAQHLGRRAPPPKPTVNTVERNEIYNWENGVGPFFGTQIFGPQSPPSPPALLMLPWGGGGRGTCTYLHGTSPPFAQARPQKGGRAVRRRSRAPTRPCLRVPRRQCWGVRTPLASCFPPIAPSHKCLLAFWTTRLRSGQQWSAGGIMTETKSRGDLGTFPPPAGTKSAERGMAPTEMERPPKRSVWALADTPPSRCSVSHGPMLGPNTTVALPLQRPSGIRHGPSASEVTGAHQRCG